MSMPFLGFRWRCVANGSVFPWPPREGDTVLPGGPCMASPTHACPPAGAGCQFQNASWDQTCPSTRDVPGEQQQNGACFLTKAAAAAQLQEMAAVQKSMGTTVLPVLLITEGKWKCGSWAHCPNYFHDWQRRQIIHF